MSAERGVTGSITGADAQGRFLSSIRAPVPSSRPCTFRPARAVAVKVGRRDERPAFSSVSRPRLDGGEHGGRLKASREPDQPRFLKRQLSFPVSMMSQWCVSRSRSAVVILASMNTLGHSPKARLVVTMMEVRS